MYRGPCRQFKVVSHPEGKFAVWFADAPKQRPWIDVGHVGTEDQCWDYVEDSESSDGFWFQFAADR